MNCLKCNADNLRDYPTCLACEPHIHFTHRADCRCDDCAPLSTLHLRYENAVVGSERAADLAIRINRRNALTPIVWCEACFSDTCAHTAQAITPEAALQVVIEILPKIGQARFLGGVPR